MAGTGIDQIDAGNGNNSVSGGEAINDPAMASQSP